MGSTILALQIWDFCLHLLDGSAGQCCYDLYYKTWSSRWHTSYPSPVRSPLSLCLQLSHNITMLDHQPVVPTAAVLVRLLCMLRSCFDTDTCMYVLTNTMCHSTTTVRIRLSIIIGPYDIIQNGRRDIMKSGGISGAIFVFEYPLQVHLILIYPMSYEDHNISILAVNGENRWHMVPMESNENEINISCI